MREILLEQWADEFFINPVYFYEKERCPACDSKSRKYFNYGKAIFRICSECRTVFMELRLTNIGVEKFYNSEYQNFIGENIEISFLLNDTEEKLFSSTKDQFDSIKNNFFILYRVIRNIHC